MSRVDRCATAGLVFTLLPWGAGAAVDSETPPGWEVSSEGPAPYEVRRVDEQPLAGRHSASISCGSCAANNPATLMQTILADRYRGKRVRLAGHLRTAGVERWAGFWMRVDAADRRAVSFDNMSTRAVSGTTPWARYEIVLDVPEDAVQIAFGFLLAGNGQVWADDLSLNAVAATVPSTNLRDSPDYVRVEVEEGLPTEPRNLDFEQGVPPRTPFFSRETPIGGKPPRESRTRKQGGLPPRARRTGLPSTRTVTRRHPGSAAAVPDRQSSRSNPDRANARTPLRRRAPGRRQPGR